MSSRIDRVEALQILDTCLKGCQYSSVAGRAERGVRPTSPGPARGALMCAAGEVVVRHDDGVAAVDVLPVRWERHNSAGSGSGALAYWRCGSRG